MMHCCFSRDPRLLWTKFIQMTMVIDMFAPSYNHFSESSLTLPISVLQVPLRSKLLPYITGLAQNQHRRYYINVSICKTLYKTCGWLVSVFNMLLMYNIVVQQLTKGLFRSQVFTLKNITSNVLTHAWSSKWSLFIKFFAWMGCKSRDESNKPT